MPRSTPLLGFKPPFVNGGEIVVPVLTGAGDYHDLTATPATWERLSRAIVALKKREAEQAPGVILKPGGRIL